MSQLPPSLRRFENAHIALWLLKDTCWILNLKPFALAMALPTIGLAMFITWKARYQKAELYHNIAVCFWIAANITWMIGEFFYNDTWRPAASLFFFCGLGVLAFYYLGLLFAAKQQAK